MHLLWILAILFRAYLITLPAQPYDIGTYHAWGNLMLELGPSEFFTSTWSDYLPLPIYIFSFISWLSTTLHLSFAILFKSFFSIIELGLIIWITRRSDPKGSGLLGSLLLLSPVLILNTSWWGQTDSFPALLGIISLLSLLNSRIYLAAISFALAVSFKPIIILIFPILMNLYLTSSERIPRSHLIRAALLSSVIFLLPSLFVSPNPLEAFQFLLDKSLEQASTYPYTSINAFNFWNIRSLLNHWPPDNQIILGLSLQSWGTLFFTILTANILRLWAKTGWDKSHSYRVIATIFAVFFTFTTRMHERHLLFSLPFLALATARQFWLILPYALLSLMYSFNLWAAYSWVIHAQSWPFQAIWGNVISLITTLTTLALALVWHWPHTLQNIKTWFISHKSLVLILFLALILRLTNLHHPSTHIFDEVYHAFTAQELVANNLDAWVWWTTPPDGFAYEWTHPPVAKYGMILGLSIFGDNSFAWRFFSVIMGIISIYGIHKLTFIIFNSRTTANIAAFLVSIEGLHLIQSRIAMNDIYMLTFFIWSLNYALKNRWKNSAILYGLALASKWSALYGLIPLATIYLRLNPSLFQSLGHTIRTLLQTLRLMLVAVIVYFLTYAPFILSGFTLTQLTELHRQMWYYHTHLVATHAYQSTPLQWIFSLRPVWYWVDYGDKISNIYAQSNPLLLWLGLVALVLQLRKLKKFPYIILYTLYAILTLPWIFSPRIMFFYHYFPSTTFLMIILASWLSSLPTKTRDLFIILCSISYVLLSPLYYGFPMTKQYWDTLFSIFPTWK